MKLWHRRLGHLSPSELARIHKSGLVDGFKVSGPVTSSCKCDTCRQARIRRVATPRSREYESLATFIGHTVSSDVKVLPYTSFRGDRYCVVYVDHYSRLSFVYFISSKNQVLSTLRAFIADLARLGFRCHNIQTDRGSEYFEQEGESRFNAGRRLHEFNRFCESQSPPITHIVQPVEMKEKLAENRFLDLFKDVDCMLWEARLSPAFWADACAYATGKPLQTLLDAAFASCSVTVRQLHAAAAAAASLRLRIICFACDALLRRLQRIARAPWRAGQCFACGGGWTLRGSSACGGCTAGSLH